ncbi:MAG: DUF6702 family protein [Blastocatellia bacterium]|nr:DUF6702 family protein [Blastocatellia bacterium]
MKSMRIPLPFNPAVALSLLWLTLLALPLDGEARAAALHKFHVSVSQVEYNASGQSVEVVMRIYSDDFENALSRHAKRPVKIDPARDKEMGEVVMSYLRGQFELKTRAGKPVKFTWVGLEAQVDMFWLYFEGKVPGGFSGAQLKNRVLCELFEDQVNIVNVKYQGKQAGTMFEPKDEFKPISELKAAK